MAVNETSEISKKVGEIILKVLFSNIFIYSDLHVLREDVKICISAKSIC